MIWAFFCGFFFCFADFWEIELLQYLILPALFFYQDEGSLEHNLELPQFKLPHTNDLEGTKHTGAGTEAGVAGKKSPKILPCAV